MNRIGIETTHEKLIQYGTPKIYLNKKQFVVTNFIKFHRSNLMFKTTGEKKKNN